MYLVLLVFYPDADLHREQKALVSVLMGIGAIVGWFSLGKRMSNPVERAGGIELGIRAAITCAVWSLLSLGLLRMLYKIQGADYRDPTNAILDIFRAAFFNAQYLMNWQVAGIGLFLGICAGVLTQNASKLWK